MDFAMASVAGRHHTALGHNNQDACLVIRQSPQDLRIALVADGCGSGKHSELGARLGIRIAARNLLQCYALNGQVRPEGFRWWDYLTAHIVSELRASLRLLALGEPPEETVRNHLLFTLLGVVIDNQTATFFAAGDGLFVINGEPTLLEADLNAPAYLGYLTLDNPPMPAGLRPIATVPLSELHSFMLATDGATDLAELAGMQLPRQHEQVMDLTAYPDFDPFYANPDRLRRYLSLVQKEVAGPDGEAKKNNLPDDTTLVIGRTREEI